jgi:hypothetical protein
MESSSRSDTTLLRSTLYTFFPIRVKTKNFTDSPYSTYFNDFCNYPHEQSRKKMNWVMPLTPPVLIWVDDGESKESDEIKVASLQSRNRKVAMPPYVSLRCVPGSLSRRSRRSRPPGGYLSLVKLARLLRESAMKDCRQTSFFPIIPHSLRGQ